MKTKFRNLLATKEECVVKNKGLKVSEIAEIVGITASGVRKRLRENPSVEKKYLLSEKPALYSEEIVGELWAHRTEQSPNNKALLSEISELKNQIEEKDERIDSLLNRIEELYEKIGVGQKQVENAQMVSLISLREAENTKASYKQLFGKIYLKRSP